MTNLATFERVDGALDSLLRAGDFMTCADPRAWVRKSSALLDACLDAGMDYDTAEPTQWAVQYVTSALVTA